METMIWNILGYTSMPLIFVFGFVATALLACMVMDMLGIESDPA
ncbi:MAG: TIGR02808 family protein [Motiliproteus sp.]